MATDVRDDLRTEWARVDPQRIVVATSRGASIHRVEPDDLSDPFATPMRGRGMPETTRWLLDGAIGAAAFGRASVRASGPMTPLRWLWRLAGYYCTTAATSRLLPVASQRFKAAGRRTLQAWAEKGTREERGHDELALRDIRALGYNPEQVIRRFQPHAVTPIVEYFRRAIVDEPDPIGCVGYSYALERLAAEKGLDDVAAVQAILPPDVNATRCLRVHSGSGSDAAHVADTIEIVVRLSASERIAVARACYETARLFYAPPRAEPTERELHDLLAADDRAHAESEMHSPSEEDRWQRRKSSSAPLAQGRRRASARAT